MPYQTKPGYLYIPCKRGDGIIAPNKPEQMRMRNGMCGGYIDPDDWTTKPEISKYSQGETLWIEVPKTDANKQFCIDAGMPVNAPVDGKQAGKTYRPMKHWIDFSALTPHVPDFAVNVYEHKKPIPVMKLNALPVDAIKSSSLLKLSDKLIADVGQITTGNYTVGPAAGDNYPTLGGAGGGVAALGNLTGNLTFTLTGNITEVAQAQMTEVMGGFTLTVTSNAPHYGDPTQGWLITYNGAVRWLDLQMEGPGVVDVGNLHTIWIAGAGANGFDVQNVIIALTIRIHDLLLNTNNIGLVATMSILDATPTVEMYNIVEWDNNRVGGNGISIGAGNAANRYENITAYNNATDGFDLNAQGGTMINCCAYDNGTDFANIGAATGTNNRSSDATAANANWLVGVGNTVGAVVLADVQGVNDAVANFFDILDPGPLVDAGVANGIAARTVGIRNRVVPNSRGATSVGPAETVPPTPTPTPTGRGGAVPQSRIAIHNSLGLY